MVLSCSTSEYIFRSRNGESTSPCSTALAMVPMPACSGCSAGDSLPARTSRSRKSLRWPAMLRVSSSGGSALEGLSSLAVMTMAAIFSGSIGIYGRPMRCSGAISGIGWRYGRWTGK
ncbi:hypothetical protein D3C72_1496860 [compost metagenome]